MRRSFAFLVWLFRFLTWIQGSFLRWLRSRSSRLASRETAEQLLSQDGQQESSELARFLSSLPKDARRCHHLHFYGDLEVSVSFGLFRITLRHKTGVRYSEFLKAVASSEIVFSEEVSNVLVKDEACKHVEAFADALHQSSNKFRNFHIVCQDGLAVPFAKCVSNVLLKNDAIQHLTLRFCHLKDEMGKELGAEFMGIIGVPRNLQILKSFTMGALQVDGDGMEQLMKPFQSLPNVLEYLGFHLISSDAQLEHISGMLTSSTSLKSLKVSKNPIGMKKTFTRGYSSIASALCFNHSLEALQCDISSSLELKVLLDPLIPKNNNLQCNTTLTKLHLSKPIGGKEWIEPLVDLIHTNTSLLELKLNDLDGLSLHDIQGVENVLAILEALKRNKSLKRIDFGGCKGVSGYKILGAMMDLLLENHNIQDIGLQGTGLEKSGDAEYVSSALSKRKKMKLQDIVQNMPTMVNPTYGRVFLCGQPFAGKL